MFRKTIVTCFVAAIFAASVSPASAGLFCKKKDCCPEPACCEAPEPVCCEAPAPVCPPPAPVCCEAPARSWNAEVYSLHAATRITKTVCLCDACGCMKAVDLCIPACCANEEPCITCRRGLFGRKIYTLTWKCCGHTAKVVMTKLGKVRVH